MFSELMEHDGNDDLAMKESSMVAGQVPNEA
jgi:hypothetical protein